MRRGFACLAIAATTTLFFASPARADGDNTGPDRGVYRVGARVPVLCQIGGSGLSSTTFAMGTLVDTATGYLRRDLQAESKQLGDTWCNAPSQIEITAVELTPQTGAPRLRDGFARAVEFTATVSGWSTLPAVYRTDGATTQADAIQPAGQPRVATLVVGVSDFRMRDGALIRPVASPTYLGAVIVTLRPVP